MFRCQVSRSAGQPDPDCLKRFFWGTTYVLYDANRRKQKCIFGNFSSYRVAGLSKLRCRACLAPLSVGDFVSVTSLIVNSFFFFCLLPGFSRALLLAVVTAREERDGVDVDVDDSRGISVCI